MLGLLMDSWTHGLMGSWAPGLLGVRVPNKASLA